ncbi:hypothetical protein NPIL_631811 [Nephila pilipes]|uniref:Uncharacterized protein n=1 Tax=Nephila pilipes TaxID=299642 RepID=A0A8X6PAW2_NEPPI|nr:hypothetical protein NPIL_631811 [Nephila pilipes]
MLVEWNLENAAFVCENHVPTEECINIQPLETGSEELGTPGLLPAMIMTLWVESCQHEKKVGSSPQVRCARDLSQVVIGYSRVNAKPIYHRSKSKYVNSGVLL